MIGHAPIGHAPLPTCEIRIGTGMSEYVCPTCDLADLRAGRFVAVPEECRAYRGQERRLPEMCPICRVSMVWTPTASATDLLREDFIIDVGEGPRRVSSLSELRGIERSSLRKAANGEGAALNFRGFSQNRSNKDRNSLAGTSLETNRQIPMAEIRRRTTSGLPITVRARPEEG